MSTKLQVHIFKNGWDMTENMSKQALLTSFEDFTVIFQFRFFDRFWCFKKCFRVIFSRSLRKSDLKTCIAALNHDFFAWPFLLGDLTWPWPLLWPQNTGNDANKCQWHYQCRFIGFVCVNIEIVLADVAKPEKSNILTLTWPVTSSVTSRSNFIPFLESSRIEWLVLIRSSSM